jgi:hypothetical protein
LKKLVALMPKVPRSGTNLIQTEEIISNAGVPILLSP